MATILADKSNELDLKKPKLITVQADINFLVPVMGADGCLF
jgi:hypothetical protein